MYTPPLMQPTFKVTIFFLDPGTRLSWSESYYPMSLQTTDACIEPAVNLANARTNLNAATIQTINVRISNEAIQRDAYLFTSPKNGLIQTSNDDALVQDNTPAEVPYSTVLVREQSTSLYHAQRYLSGIADAVITDPPGPKLVNQFGNSWNTFKNLLMGLGKGKLLGQMWGMLVQSKQAADTVPAQLQTITFAGSVATMTLNGVFVAPGDVIRIYGAKWAAPAGNPGNMMVLTANQATGVVTAQVSGSGAGILWLGGGRVQRLRRILAAYTDIYRRGETHRKRGGRFFLPAGKSRKRV